MIIIRKKQIKNLGEKNYIVRMRKYLNESFPESCNVPSKDMDRAIVELTKRAKRYKLFLKIDLAPFIVGAWLMGFDFDEKFIAVKSVLRDFNLTSCEKSEFLWQFIEEAFRLLEE